MTQPTPRDSQDRVRLPYFSTAQAEFSLSQTLRRLAHISRREALAEELTGNLPRYTAAALEHRRLWRDALWHLGRAKMNRERAIR